MILGAMNKNRQRYFSNDEVFDRFFFLWTLAALVTTWDQILAEDEILFVGLERKLEGVRLWCSPPLQGPLSPPGYLQDQKAQIF